MPRHLLLSAALLLTLFAPACGSLRCKNKEDVYAGGDVLPYEQITADELLAQAELSFSEQRTWVPNPAEYEESYYSELRRLPYEGTTRLDIEVTPLSDELVDPYSHDFEYGCEAGGAPAAPVLITIRTGDGVLDEEVEGTLVALNGEAHISATITRPTGRIREYFAGYDEPEFPMLSVEIEPGLARLELVLERRWNDGASWDYLTLL